MAAYAWLFRIPYRATQDHKIRRMVELQAYLAIRASGGRPDALAQLIGVIRGDGRRLPIERVSELEFAKRHRTKSGLRNSSTPGTRG
jgi:hypothetical protein